MKSNRLYAAAALLTVACLAGCGPKPAAEASYSDAKITGDAATAEMAPAQAPANDAKPSDAEVALRVPQLAYDYSYTFQANVSGVDSLIKADQGACDRAGVVNCQMISLSSNSDRGAAYVSKTLELRVSQTWLKAWQASLESSVAKAHGRISYQNVSSEDLSLQIVDTAAHIQNKQALRDRLIQIIKTNPGKISDLVEAETQLSQVQEDIDASQSALAVMQKRVATTHLTLSYQSEAVAASEGTFSPLMDAFKSILRNMVLALSLIINLLSFLVPLLLIGVPALWYGLKWYRNRKPRVEPKPQAGTPDEK